MNCYVIVSLLADPNNSQSLCTPHPTTFLKGACPQLVADGEIDLESPFLFSLLDQEEETHLIHSSSPLDFNR
jgi:hypothetical protein